MHNIGSWRIARLSSSSWRCRHGPFEQLDGFTLSLLEVALAEQDFSEYLIGHRLIVRQRLQMLGEGRGHFTLMSQVSVHGRRCQSSRPQKVVRRQLHARAKLRLLRIHVDLRLQIG